MLNGVLGTKENPFRRPSLLGNINNIASSSAEEGGFSRDYNDGGRPSFNSISRGYDQ
jgi:hypothetical protein